MGFRNGGLGNTNASNGYSISAANIDSVLALNSSHTWGNVNSAVWSTGDFENDTLTMSLGTGGATPTVAVWDTITISADTWWWTEIPLDVSGKGADLTQADRQVELEFRTVGMPRSIAGPAPLDADAQARGRTVRALPAPGQSRT